MVCCFRFIQHSSIC